MLAKVAVYLGKFVKLSAIFRVVEVVSEISNRKENPASHKRGKKTEESPFAAKEWELVRLTKRNQTQIHSEALIQNYEMPLESHAFGNF